MTAKYTNLEQIRLDKLERLRQRGIEPYPTRAQRTHTSLQAIHAFEAAEAAGNSEPVKATLAGRIRSTRPMGKITFAHIEDGEGRVQLFLRANELGEEQLDLFNREFDLGDFVQASGEMFRTRTGEVTLRVESFRLLAKAVTPLPAAKDQVVDGELVQYATLSEPELRYRQRYADLAVNQDVRQIFRIRSLRCGPCAISSIRTAFWRSRRPCCSRSTAGRRRGHSRRTTTSSNRTCTCAFRSSCTSNACW